MGTLKNITIPNESENLAEFIGIVLGDGNIDYHKSYKIGTYAIRIAGHAELDYEYLTKYVFSLAQNLFNTTPKIHFSKTSNAIYLSIYSRKLVEFFIEMKLINGNKIKNGLRIPFWIWKKNSYLKSCLRGLYDTDGSVYELLPHWPGLFQIYFSNKNSFLLEDVRNALLKLNIQVSKISHQNGRNTPRIYITKKDQVKKFYKEIGFKNSKHLKKLIELRSLAVN